MLSNITDTRKQRDLQPRPHFDRESGCIFAAVFCTLRQLHRRRQVGYATSRSVSQFTTLFLYIILVVIIDSYSAQPRVPNALKRRVVNNEHFKVLRYRNVKRCPWRALSLLDNQVNIAVRKLPGRP